MYEIILVIEILLWLTKLIIFKLFKLTFQKHLLMNK